MNKQNLQRMADYIRTVPQEKFSMEFWRSGRGRFSPECNSVGCVVGHCTILDTPENLYKFDNGDGVFYYRSWANDFTGLDIKHYSYFDWCFASAWAGTDNTPNGAAARIEYLLNNGLPENWIIQMLGNEPLCYKK